MKIEFNNVSFSYDNKVNVLENINFVLDKSEIVFILGHTGSGKSTLIQQLNGLLFPSKGEVKIVYKDYFINEDDGNYISGINDHRIETSHILTFEKNINALDAGIVIACFVCGLIPCLAALFFTLNVPKPARATSSPAFKASATVSTNALYASSASLSVKPALLAIELTTSPLFIKISPFLLKIFLSGCLDYITKN